MAIAMGFFDRNSARYSVCTFAHKTNVFPIQLNDNGELFKI